MRILQVHNKYLHYGGEDAVVDNEFKLLCEQNVAIKQVFFDNTDISPTSLFNNKSSYEIIKKEIEEFKPSVMHVHNIFYNATPSVLKAAKSLGVPVVMTLHNFRLLCPGGLFLRDSKVCTKCKDISFPYYGVVHKCFKGSLPKSLALSLFLGINKSLNVWNTNVDKFVVLTPFIKELLLNSSINLPESKIEVKPNSTDDFLNPMTKTNKREGFLFVGRLSKEKGVDTLVKAFTKLPELRLDVIGSGDLENELKKIATKNIVFHGNQDRSFIKNKLLQTKALMFPSIWYEGLPNTIIEAFSAGTPILASNVDNVNQIVTAGYNGEIFQANNWESIKSKVIEFNNTETETLQSNARTTYINKYTHEINFNNLMKMYSELTY